MMSVFGPVGALYGALGVGLGAFGAHALRGRLQPSDLEIWHTAVKYQLVHALVLLVVELWIRHLHGSGGLSAGRSLQWSGWLFAVGTLVFSGTLYALVLSGVRKLGMVTPVGGLALIAGWLCLAWALYTSGGRA